MRKSAPIFYSAIQLTLVNLLLRFAGTSFQVYLSGKIGAAGIGLLQLTLSVGAMGLVAAMGGIRTATMYLTAEELGKNRRENVTWILSGSILYSILFSCSTAIALYCFAPRIAQFWIGDFRTVHALRCLAVFLPCSCLCGVMSGYFTAANRIGTLTAVEVAEQFLSMAVTLGTLSLWAGSDPGRACLCVVLGSSAGACFSLICLVFLRIREHAPTGPRIQVSSRIAKTALPLAVADDMRTGISTLENLIVPKRLALNQTTANPLAAFGTVSGMIFPVLMFPACILFGLAELLIPELARCNAAGSRKRIAYLMHRSLKVSFLYGLLSSGLMVLLADRLCLSLYGNLDAAVGLKLYALLIPMLYCDAITDAMIKGLGQQTASVRYNIITNLMDVLLLYFLLPVWGMKGYFVSFLVTHLINFTLSLGRLLKITGEHISFRIPLFSLISALTGAWIVSHLSFVSLQAVCYPVVLICLLTLGGILGREDLQWFTGLLRKE